METLDVEQARSNMVEQQVRTWDVLDQRVLDLLFRVKRERFVPPQWRALAFADLELPLAGRAKMWPPRMEARVLQELGLAQSDRVLEIGTGSGYFAALMASLAREVVTVEIDPSLGESARARLARMGFDNVRVETGDGANGWGSESYDAVVLTGSTPIVAEALIAQVAPGGRLFAVVGDAPAMKARIIRWDTPGARLNVDLFETVVEPLVNAPAPDRFRF
ncbi:MAG TPA: protein-L-isoaspartate O-methyltransferase [Casimicrobiaceae bacterium]|nr:protein-L-isoaspartate O-methyltransferase [Casimicrobiaceae bacterium]